MKAYDTWARPVKCKEEVPSTFLELFEESTTGLADFPSTIYAPPDRWGRRKATPKLISLLEDRLVIIEKAGREVKRTVFMLPNISFLETGTVLLYSWLKIAGCTEKGPTTCVIEFNSVVENYFRVIVEKLRQAMSRIDPAESLAIWEQEQRKFNIYQNINYKFMNFAKRSILPGENVVDQVLQADINFKYMRFFTRLAVGTHLTILTDRELIMIRDIDTFRFRNQTRYGGVWTFIPLLNITGIEAGLKLTKGFREKDKPEGQLLACHIGLTNEFTIEAEFEPAQRAEVEKFIYKIKNRDTADQECC